MLQSRWAARLAACCLLAACGACSRAPSPRDGEPGAGPRADAPTLKGVSAELAALQARARQLQDIAAVKRLQRAYGYYVDQGLWDQAADLFADDGTIEIGLDGVYVGKDRIRQYLHALGGGREGLPFGRLNEHLQLMPVVDVAPDGKTAKARWRGLIMTGRLGHDAEWGEGPYENEYVKVGGVWKISKLHWYQSMLVPYKGGWQNNKDVNGGKWVGDALPPDKPPSVDYRTWPNTYLPPFHFDNPVSGPQAPPPAPSPAAAAADAALAFPALARRAAALAENVQRLEDRQAVERLQRIYGFYIDKQMWTQAADLFADDGTIEVGGSGVYVGKKRVLAYLKHLGPEYPQQGRLNDRMQLQPIIDVAADGKTARGRWHLFAQEAVHGKYARWGLGVYENTYVKRNGVWKIAALHEYNRMFTPYADGWGEKAIPNAKPAADLPPDRPPSVDYAAYPADFVVPFHYANPVTGKPVAGGPAAGKPAASAAAAAAAAPPADTAALRALLGRLDHRLGLLQDVQSIERLNSIYGYYLARNQWDDLAAIFAPQGSIEIALRGIYKGRASIRRSLDLYGKPGIQFGLLHNHMQYQRVIDVADDGETAKMRSRAFSIMGQYGQYSMWMGGVYENKFVKIGGVWQIQHDQVFNTYFVPYAVGWKDVPSRPPPGISKSNPPDAPPSVSFKMYPHAFLPPYHYANPVTGRTVEIPK